MHDTPPSSPVTWARTQKFPQWSTVSRCDAAASHRTARTTPLPSASRACQARWARGLAGGAQAVPRNGRPCGPVSILICVAGAWGLEWRRGHKMAPGLGASNRDAQSGPEAPTRQGGLLCSAPICSTPGINTPTVMFTFTGQASLRVGSSPCCQLPISCCYISPVVWPHSTAPANNARRASLRSSPASQQRKARRTKRHRQKTNNSEKTYTDIFWRIRLRTRTR